MSHRGNITHIATILLSLLQIAVVDHQQVAGPEANPLPRMNCERAGEIRDDEGRCVPVESYFSTGRNRIYWIDHDAGSDANAGTQASPFKTIGRATGRGLLGPGDVVIVREGVYRETIAPEEDGRHGDLITFAAYPGETVVVTGADMLNEGWAKSGNAWRRAWTLPLPADPNVGTLRERPEFRREMIIVDDTVLRPVYARSDLLPGTFYVEGSDAAPEMIYMRLPDDGAPSGHIVEAGTRSALFLPKGTRDDWCGGKSGYYRLVGLTFRHAVNNANWAAVCTGANGSVLEENTVVWTNGTGINVAGKNIVLRGNRANYNGMRGIGGRCAGCRLEYNETSYNNWKAHAYGYGAAGVKLIYSTDTSISNHLSADNNGTGIWLDVKNARCVVERSYVLRNVGRGILVEYGTTDTIVRNNVVIGTILDGREGSGIQSQSASKNVFVHNTLLRNEGYGLWIRLSPRDEDGHNVIYNNLLIENAARGSRAHSEIRIDGESLAHARTNKLDGNLYGPHKATSRPFIFTSGDGEAYEGDDLATWRRLIEGDSAAMILDENRKTVVDASSVDGWRLVEGSQAIGGGAELPEGISAAQDVMASARPMSKADVGAHQFRPSADTRTGR